MPSLSEQLKALGVTVGAAGIHKRPPSGLFTLDTVLHGEVVHTHFGETYVVETHYHRITTHNSSISNLTAPLDGLAKWAQDARLLSLEPEKIAFIDTETTGLSGGTGTYAFLIGAGKFEASGFRLAQFFLRDPGEEPAQLAALESFLAPCEALVSYNGKAFDLPLIRTRFTSHGLRSPLFEYAHIDLLHLARRLWRGRLSNRSLGSIEVHILGAQRNEEDVPGWMIPQFYFDYLRSGDARPLKRVFYHNAMDILSLTLLLNHTAQILSAPLNYEPEHLHDIISLAALFEDLSDTDTAKRLYVQALESLKARTTSSEHQDWRLKALMRLALIYKRQGDFTSALNYWERAAEFDDFQAIEEIAKFYEHRAKDYQQAIQWVIAALNRLQRSNIPAYEVATWSERFTYRLARLVRKQRNSR